MSSSLPKTKKQSPILPIAFLSLLILCLSCLDDKQIGLELVDSKNIGTYYDSQFYVVKPKQYTATDSTFIITTEHFLENAAKYAFAGRIEDKKFGDIESEVSFMMQYSPSKQPPRADSVIIKQAYIALSTGTNPSAYPPFPYQMPTDIEVYTSAQHPRPELKARKEAMPTLKRVGVLRNSLPQTDLTSNTNNIRIYLDTTQMATSELKEIFFDNDIYKLVNEKPNLQGLADTVDLMFIEKEFKGFTIKSPKGCFFGFHPFFTTLVIQYGLINKPDTNLFINFPARSYQGNIPSNTAMFENRIVKKNDKVLIDEGQVFAQGFKFSQFEFSLKEQEQKDDAIISYLRVSIPIDLDDSHTNPISGIGLYSDSTLLAPGRIDSAKFVFDISNQLIADFLDLQKLSIRAGTFQPNRTILNLDSTKIEVLYSEISE